MAPNYFDIIKPASLEWNIKFTEWLAHNYLKKNMRILDLGCGQGEVVKHLAKLDYNVEGYDYPEIDLENPLKFENNSYDFIILKFVIEHVNDINLLMYEVHRILRYNGKVLILTDDYPRQVKDFWEDPTHITPMTLKRMENLAKLNYFKIITLRRWRNVPYVWRYNLNAFDFVFPFSKQLLGVFEK